MSQPRLQGAESVSLVESCKPQHAQEIARPLHESLACHQVREREEDSF